MKVLILGHKGMLGHVVYKYLSTKKDCKLITTDLRWPSQNFMDFVLNFDGDFIINCIGAIHQRTNDFKVNVDLPIWLDNNVCCKVIHPGTDNGDGEYGKSKKEIENYILKNGKVTYVIKTSIIGHELQSNVGLLDWFLKSQDKVSGYCDVQWNGNTTLQWAKICHDLMLNQKKYGKLIIPSTECISKYTLLQKIKDVYGKKDILIYENYDIKTNKCLEGNIEAPSIKNQLKELKRFYYDN